MSDYKLDSISLVPGKTLFYTPKELTVVKMQESINNPDETDEVKVFHSLSDNLLEDDVVLSILNAGVKCRLYKKLEHYLYNSDLLPKPYNKEEILSLIKSGYFVYSGYSIPAKLGIYPNKGLTTTNLLFENKMFLIKFDIDEPILEFAGKITKTEDYTECSLDLKFKKLEGYVYSLE